VTIILALNSTQTATVLFLPTVMKASKQYTTSTKNILLYAK